MTITTVSTISGGQTVTTGGSKQTGYGLAGADNSHSALCLGIAPEGASPALPGQTLTYDESGVREYPTANFTPARYVFRGADGFPTQNVSGSSAYAVLGVALTTTTVLLLLPTIGVPRYGAGPRPMSIGDDQPTPAQAADTDRPLHKAFYGIGGPDAPQPAAAKEITVEYVSNTTVRLKMMGVDGVVRGVNLVLS